MRASFLRCARRWSAGCALSVLASGAAAWAQQTVQVFQIQEGTPPGVQVQVERAAESAPVATPKLWLGLVLEPASDVLRSQLSLPPEQGLVVREVIPESPAAAAGVQQLDVLLTINETPVNDIWALIRFVEEAGSVELTLQIVRQGQRQELQLTPTERPAAAAIQVGEGGAGGGLAVPGVEWQQLVQPHYRVFMTQPGQIVARVVGQGEMPLPEGMHVAVRKQGAEPTVVVVERGEERWEVELGKLDELPDDVHAQVTAYLHSLGAAAGAGGFHFTPAAPVPAVPRIPVPHVVPFPGRAFEVPLPPGAPPAPDVLQRLDDLQRQLEELRERLESQEREAADQPDDSGLRSSFIMFRCA